MHRALENHSGAISQDPYGSWLYRIKPEKWQEETGDAVMADQASEWTARELERFRDYLAANWRGFRDADLVLQEGGELDRSPPQGIGSGCLERIPGEVSGI